MKTYLFLISSLLFNITYSQCPQSGLKVQCAICDSPNGLKIDTITCSYLKVKWQGKQNQTYRIKATEIDPSSSKTYEAEASNYSCDGSGNCMATIPVKTGSKVNWSVQGICMKDDNALPGYQVDGAEATIPICVSAINSSFQTLRAYPNPTTGILNVEYRGTIIANTNVLVSDMVGKKVFYVSGNSLTRTGTGFQLDLHNLLSGNYVLHVTNGKDQSQVKFVLIRN